MNQNVEVSLNDQNLEQLRHDIRYGFTSYSSKVIKQWLKVENFQQTCVFHQLERLTQQFHLLLEVIYDDILPLKWRKICYQNIFYPLFKLRELADLVGAQTKENDSVFQQIDLVFTEFRIGYTYFAKSLGERSCNCGNH